MDNETCTWKHHVLGDFDYWQTACNEELQLGSGTPSANGMKFCCYCGQPLEEVSDAAMGETTLTIGSSEDTPDGYFHADEEIG